MCLRVESRALWQIRVEKVKLLVSSQLMLNVLLLISITWVWNALYWIPADGGWRGFIKGVGWGGFLTLWLSGFMLSAAQMAKRPFHDDEFLFVLLVELAVLVISSVCIFIPDWFPASKDAGDME